MFNWSRVFMLLTILFFVGCAQGGAKFEPPMYSVQPAKQNALWTIEWWNKRHREKKELAKQSDVELLMLGDSITHGWENSGAPIWAKYYAPRKAFNLGFSGDRTEHVLWRLQNGALDNLSPKLTVLMIGTNNTGHRMDPAAHTAAGIQAIISELRSQLPESKILLLGVFPRHAHPSNDMRQRNIEINEIIANFADDDVTHYLDLGDVFLDERGVLSKALMPDMLHPNEDGYAVWAEAMEPSLQRLFAN